MLSNFQLGNQAAAELSSASPSCVLPQSKSMEQLVPGAHRVLPPGAARRDGDAYYIRTPLAPMCRLEG